MQGVKHKHQQPHVSKPNFLAPPISPTNPTMTSGYRDSEKEVMSVSIKAIY
jgi:hypothetical protein